MKLTTWKGVWKKAWFLSQRVHVWWKFAFPPLVPQCWSSEKVHGSDDKRELVVSEKSFYPKSTVKKKAFNVWQSFPSFFSEVKSTRTLKKSNFFLLAWECFFDVTFPKEVHAYLRHKSKGIEKNEDRESFFRVLGKSYLVKNLFRLIRFINRINSRPIWARTGEKRHPWKKVYGHCTNSNLKKTHLFWLKSPPLSERCHCKLKETLLPWLCT